jgi:flagellar hook assembly protein FlgD
LPVAAHAKVAVFNVLGQRVKTLIDGDLPVGRHTVVWDGTDERGSSVASGVYLYRLWAGDFSESKKMILQK